MLIKKLPRVMAAGAAAMALHSAEAVVVQHSFTFAGGNSWQASFSITNDGGLPEVNSFTVFFDQPVASNLQLLASPSNWDTIVIQPDVALASSGFMDALVFDPANALLLGQTAKGFGVSFEWNAAEGLPRSFDFTVNDAGFNVLASGITVASVTAVPEPSTLLLLMLGTATLGAFARRRAKAV